MKILFISDLHLSAKRPDISALFLHFLQTHAKTADALYILGDFFEVWLGIDTLDNHDISILQALKSYQQTGKRVYFMHGNRDFLIDESFAVQSGCILISDPTELSITLPHFKNRWVVCHGDALCTLDKAYQRYRKFVRHPWIKAFFLKLPKWLRRKIASSLRKKSKAYQKKYIQSPQKWDVAPASVEKLLNDYKATILVHGHTHKPNIHDFVLNNTACKRIVLGDWDETGNFLEVVDDHLEYKVFDAISIKN